MGFVVVAVWFSVMGAGVLIATIAQWRFYRAYHQHYGGLWSLPSWFHGLDDPLLERRRREFLLVWFSTLAVVAIPPSAYVLYGAFTP